MIVGEASVLRQRQRTLALFVAGGWAAYGVLHALVWTISAREPSYFFRFYLPCALAMAAVCAIATPAVFFFANALVPSRRGWVLSILGHMVGAFALATLLTLVRRASVSAFIDRTPDDYWRVFTWWLDVWLFIYITLVVVGRALEMRRRYGDRVVRANLLEMQLARAQLQFLETQLQPHFLFNALNAIQELAHEAPNAAERMLRKLRTLLRMSLERTGENEVSLAEEIAALEPYFDIQRTRFSTWLSVRYDIPNELAGASVPHLVLQPLVENAIRHGLAVRQGSGEVTIRARRRENTLVLYVEDDGVGLRPGVEASSGIGLRNAGERLRQLYGSDQRLVLSQRPEGGARATVEIPYREHDGASNAIPSVDEITAWHTGEFVAPEAAVAPRDVSGPPRSLIPALLGADWVHNREPSTRSESSAPPLSLRLWLGIGGLWLLLAAFWTNQLLLFTSLRASTTETSLWRMVQIQLAGAGVWLVLSIAVLTLAPKMRLTAGNWMWMVPVHAAAALGCGVFHLVALRALGFGDMPVFSTGNLNPLTGDFFIYLALLAWSHARDFVAWFNARQLESARLAASIAQSRFQALRVQLRPEFVLSTLELLERMVHRDVDRAERLIARLADTLRLTLTIGAEPFTTLAAELELVSASIEAHRLGIREGVRLRVEAPLATRLESLPSRLLCGLVDELIGNVSLPPGAPLEVSISCGRVSEALHVRVAAVLEGQNRTNVSHLWWTSNGFAQRTVEHAGPSVTILIPDDTSVLVVVSPRDRSLALSTPASEEVYMAAS